MEMRTFSSQVESAFSVKTKIENKDYHLNFTRRKFFGLITSFQKCCILQRIAGLQGVQRTVKEQVVVIVAGAK